MIYGYQKKKRIILVIKGVVKEKKGSFTIEELKRSMNMKLKHRNFNNVLENEREVEEFVKKMQREKRLFRYKESDSKYFFVH